MGTEIAEKVKEIVQDSLGVKEEEVILEAKLIDDLGADSLDGLDIILGLEDEFDIEISDEEKIKTVGDAVSYIEGRLVKK